MDPPARTHPPTLAAFLRAARVRSGLSRDKLAFRAGISSSYMAQLETGEKARPSQEALTAVVAALGLTGDERQHVFDLAGLEPTRRGQGVEITAIMHEALQAAKFPAFYCDELWTVYDANDACEAALPGLRASGNMLRWLFRDPAARYVLLDWGDVADATVAWWRGIQGATRDNENSAYLLRELAELPDFRERWARGEVAFGMHRPYVRVRHPVTGAPSVLYMWTLATLDRSVPRLLSCIGVPLPASAAPPAAPRAGAGAPFGPALPVSDIKMPILGDYLKNTRLRRGLSREQLAAAAAVSVSYIAQLESGDKAKPSEATLRALADVLGMDGAERRHAYNLAGLPVAIPGEDRAVVITAGMRRALNAIPCYAGFYDEYWNVLAANDLLEDGFPGLRKSGNYLLWLFDEPAAKDVMVDWEFDTRQAVEMLRAMRGTAKHNEIDKTAALFDALNRHPKFREMWLGYGVRYHGTRSHLRMRDAHDGRPYRLYIVVRRSVVEFPPQPLVGLGVRLSEPNRDRR